MGGGVCAFAEGVKPDRRMRERTPSVNFFDLGIFLLSANLICIKVSIRFSSKSHKRWVARRLKE